MSPPTADCILDHVQFYDTEQQRYGYAVACVADHACGHWRHLFTCDEATA